MSGPLPVHERFAAHARRAPDALSLCAPDARLSYGEVHAQAQALARALRAHGVGPGVVVGVLCERSAAWVVSLLGVLAAGGAYLPLDPALPDERLALMLADAGARALVTRAVWRARLRSELPVLVYERDVAAAPGAALASGAGMGDLAYVIYTSGSTGLPKGVEIEHGALASLVDWHVDCYRVTPADRASQMAAVGFDASVWELWPYLASGASVHVVDEAARLEPARLRAWLCEQAISLAFVPTPLAAPLLHESWPPHTALRALLTGGDRLLAAPPAGLPFRLVNHYGPTEAAVVATAGDVPPGESQPPSIGWPIGATEAHVLDARLEPVAPGQSGELFLGGPSLARGYRGRAAATAGSFVPDAFGAPGARLYRTGDRVRLRPDGALDFLGRIDAQLKIRGQRIEPGEIEAALVQQPGVREALVVAWPRSSGELRLVAYVVPPEAQAAPAPADLRRALAARLPEAMLPAQFVMLDALALTAHGKLDRRALPEPPEELPRARPYRAPHTPLEELLAQIWATLLGVEQVGLDDDFVELGGHSLLAAQAIARVNETLGVELPLGALFAPGTLCGLAEAVSAARGEGRRLPPFEVADRTRPLPLTFAQEQVWFLSQLVPDNIAYNFQATLHLRGALDAAALERALLMLLERHEVLRSAFVAQGDRPVQIVGPTPPFALPVEDLRALPASQRAGEVERRVRAELQQPFDLGHPPLVRWRLYRTADDEHVLLQMEHHFVHDGWSFALLLRELCALYAACAAGRPSPLPPPERQYGDFAVWQREVLEREALEAPLAYWRDTLRGSPPALDLPADRPRPPLPTLRGAGERIELPGALYDELRAFSRRERVTLFVTMLAAFQTLLLRTTGEDDLVIGSAVANRRLRATEGIPGMFVTPLVLRTDLSGDPTFRELLARVRAVTLGAYAHQDVPFPKLVEALQRRRDVSRNPLFQVLFAFHDAPVPELRLGDVEGRVFERHNGSAKFDLNVVAIPRAEQRAGTGAARSELGLTLIWEYSTDLFERDTALRLYRRFERLMGLAVAAPTRRLSEFELLDDVEREQVVRVFGVGPLAGEDARCAHELFEDWAARQPEAPAVDDGREALTYGQLERRSAALAARLRQVGIGAETCVGVLCARSSAWVVAVLGVARSGGVYVPLDAQNPAARLRAMARDAGLRALVCDDSDLAARLLDGGLPVIATRVDAPAGTPAPVPSARQAAYVIYTSGSTGTPKGVLVEHGALANLARWQARVARLGPGQRVSQLGAVGFDASVWELWGTLGSGASLHVVDDEARLSASALRACLCARDVDVAFVPTPLAEPLWAEPWPADTRLRRVQVGGERLRRQPPAGLPFEVINAYGPTEAAVVSSAAVVAPGDDGRAPAIGRPIDGASAYVLDARLEPQPIGVPGELFIGGAGVARGYLGQPALTALAFRPDPWSAQPGARMYATGDRACWRADGELHYLGRADQQVKLRGQRIELGEIERCLLRHADVADAVLALHGEGAGARLVAYVVPRAGSALDESALRRHTRAALPEAMLPALYVTLEALPLTPTGKVDRRALPEPQASQAERDGGALEGPLEELVAQVWGDVLGRTDVAPGDDFFDLGGHSLLAMQACARLRQALQADVPVRALFEAPLLRDFARRLSSAAPLVAPPLVPRPRAPEGEPLSFAQERLWFLDQLAPGRATYNVPWALRLQGALDAAALQRALQALVERHEVLRSALQPTPHGPRQILQPAGTFALRQLDLEACPERLMAELCAEAAQPFDLAHGPLMRALLVREAATRHVLLLTLHHVASDGWSLGVLGRELGALYRGASLPALPLQYADFARWQRESLGAAELLELLGFWRATLDDLAPLDLPLDRPRPAVDSQRGARLEQRWPAALHEGLRALGRRHGATLFMLLQAGLLEVLQRTSGQSRLALGTPVAGRTRPEVEPLIGFFANTLVLVTDVGGAGSFVELLARARASALAAWSHQDVPFERLVAELQPERDQSRTPFFQVLLVVQNAPLARFDVPGLSATPLSLDLGIAKFDLGLSFDGSGDELDVLLQYNSELFERATAERLLGHVRTLLEGALVSPEGPRAELPLLAEAERRQVVEVWNARPAPAGAPACLHELFEEQARARPQARALTDGTSSWTYAQLDARAEQLAAWLRLHGVARGTRVGVCLSRTVELVAALLGVLKAGGAYVGLDPHYPSERLAFMVRDSASAVVLTEGELSGRADWGASRVVRVEECAGGPVTSIARGASSAARDVAYVIYTSGSTGVPKGVAIEHHSAVARVRWAAGEFDEQELGGVLAGTSVCFDLSIFELFVPLCLGGRVVLAPDVLALARHAARDEVRLINSVPSAVSELVRQQALPASVTTVNLAGEALRNRLCQELYATGHVKRVLNLYGPSEDTTYSTGVQVRSGAQDEPSIGRPLPGTRAYVLDGLRRPVPVGVVGELYLGGVGLSRGYLGRAELTAWRYVPDEFGAPGERLYRTGDLARWRADGELQFLGRGDHQVKVRGFRIELGEVEAALLSQVGVQDAAVQARGEAGTADQVLVAYVEARAGALLSVEDLRSALASRLPAHEVPSTFVLLERLPRTPNGKLDRARLPAPSAERPELQAAYVAPRNLAEELLAQIWGDVLGHERVGVLADFFHLGGHSLLATRVVAHLRAALGVELPLRALFDAPTIALLAPRVEELIAAQVVADGTQADA